MIKKTIVITMITMCLCITGCSSQGSNKTSTEKDNKQSEAKVIDAKDDKTKSEDKDASKNGTVKPTTPTKPNVPTKPTEGEKQQQDLFYGQWVIKKQLASGPVGTYSNEDIKNMIGKKLSFSKEKASCFGDQIKSLNDTAINPIYKKIVISKSELEKENRIVFDKLGINGDSVTKINVMDSNGKVCEFFIKDNNTLVLFGGGVYLELVRE